MDLHYYCVLFTAADSSTASNNETENQDVERIQGVGTTSEASLRKGLPLKTMVTSGEFFHFGFQFLRQVCTLDKNAHSNI